MNELRVYKEQTVIQLFKGEAIITTADVKQIAKAVNSGVRLIEIGGNYIAASNICQISTNRIGEIESFILNFDKDQQQRLRQILKKREEQGFKISIEILRNVYKKTYGEDLCL